MCCDVQTELMQKQKATENQIKMLQANVIDPKATADQINELQLEMRQKQKAAEDQVKELQLEMGQKQKAAEKIYVESVINLEGPSISKAVYLDVLNRSKAKSKRK